jgi:hypothetical protein
MTLRSVTLSFACQALWFMFEVWYAQARRLAIVSHRPVPVKEPEQLHWGP